MIQASISSDVRERIVAAAVELYELAGRERFPTVDAVRRLSRADMNTVSGVMKEWRQAQTVQAAPVTVVVPDTVQQASNGALASLWGQAVELANQSLRAAQAGWEAERQDLDSMRAELADGYEVQALELDATKKNLAISEATLAEQVQEIARLRQAAADASNAAELADARSAELQKRGEDLRGELDRGYLESERQRGELVEVRAQAAAAQESANAAIEGLRAELTKAQDSAVVQLVEVRAQAAAAQESANATIEGLRAELTKAQDRAEAQAKVHTEQFKQLTNDLRQAAERLATLEVDRDAAHKRAGDAREEAAKLAGKLEAVERQNAELLTVIRPSIQGAAKK